MINGLFSKNKELNDLHREETYEEIEEQVRGLTAIRYTPGYTPLNLNGITWETTENSYNMTSDTFPMYGYGYGSHTLDGDFSIYSTEDIIVNNLEHSIKIEEKRLELERAKRRIEIWVQNLTDKVIMLDPLGISIDIYSSSSTNIMEFMDIEFIKENSKEIFDFLETIKDKINIFYQENGGRPIIGLQNIKKEIDKQNGIEEKKKPIDDVIDMLELE